MAKAKKTTTKKKSKKFFQEQQEQSLVKANIVAKYFNAWSKVMIANGKKFGRIERLAYIDLFCGPGRYQDGSKSTPIMVLEQSIENPDLAKLLVTMFNDKDATNASSLEAAIAELKGIEKLKHKPSVYCGEVDDDATAMFENARLCPTFSFVDPFGYKGLSAKFIRAIIKDWGCDCVFFFNYSRINAGISNDKVAKHMDSLFGEKRAAKMRGYVKDKSPQQREVFILEELANALKSMGAEFVLPFRFKRSKKKRTSHALIFVTKNIRGYEIMKAIMARESSTEDEGVPSFAYSPADAATPLLFSLARPIEGLARNLQVKFAGKTMTMSEVYDSHHVDTPFISKNYKKALGELEAAGKIDADPPASKRRVQNGERTFADTVSVTFPKKVKHG